MAFNLPSQGKIPQKVYIGFSGGVDSMAVAHYLMNRRNISLIFIDHGDNTNDHIAKNVVVNFAQENVIPLDLYHIEGKIPSGVSHEDYWRKYRYEVFHSYTDPVITCHHLDDCVETWVWSSLHGCGKIIPYQNKNVIRPYRMLKKQRFYNYCEHHGLTWYEDPDNLNTKYMRQTIRHELMSGIRKVSPGIDKVIRKKVVEDFS